MLRSPIVCSDLPLNPSKGGGGGGGGGEKTVLVFKACKNEPGGFKLGIRSNQDRVLMRSDFSFGCMVREGLIRNPFMHRFGLASEQR